jgi:hypothetical protein
MDRVDEEIQCMTTIGQSVSHALRCSFGVVAAGHVGDAPQCLSVGEACEFADLAGQLLESDGNEFRVQTLLREVQPPLLQVLVDVLTTDPAPLFAGDDAGDALAEFNSLQDKCLCVIAKVCTLCSQSPSLVEWAREHVTDCRGIDVALRYVLLDGVAPTVRLHAMEIVYASVTKLGLVEEAVALGVVTVLCELLPRGDGVMMLNYACAVLRQIVDAMPEKLLDDTFVLLALNVVHEAESKFVVVLLCDVLSTVFSTYPRFFLERVPADVNGLLVAVVEGVLQRAEHSEALAAVTKLVETCLVLDAMRPPPRDGEVADGTFVHQFTASRVWLQLLSARNDAQMVGPRATKMRTFRLFVQCVSDPFLVDEIVSTLSGDTASLSVLLASPLKLPPFQDRDGDAFTLEGTLAMALLLAKHPLFRHTVRVSQATYPGWLQALEPRMMAVLEENLAAKDDVAGVVIVDAGGNVLNCVPFLDEHAPAAWCDLRVMEQAVADGFLNQAQLIDGEGSAHLVRLNKPATPPAHGGAPQHSIHASQKQLALTLAVFTYAICVTFQPVEAEAPRVDTPPQEAIAASRGVVNAYTTDVTESISRWEAEEDDAIDEPHATRPAARHVAVSHAARPVARHDAMPHGDWYQRGMAKIATRESASRPRSQSGDRAASVASNPPQNPYALHAARKRQELELHHGGGGGGGGGGAVPRGRSASIRSVSARTASVAAEEQGGEEEDDFLPAAQHGMGPVAEHPGFVRRMNAVYRDSGGGDALPTKGQLGEDARDRRPWR